ncbi:MAG TPA: trypsin-like peptidase domain-containing protein [Oligoflexia bacterium]|nr:trypsin-like peptidase domain-containing protein [Oligoflexia bacterium]HMR25232.1 trypsin-like peptidase domain-containing protein [Oligoflexia bacterium]
MQKLIVAYIFFTSLVLAQNQAWQELEQKMRPTVVKLYVANSIGLDNDFPYSGTATGFIVDKKRGIIATNRHVTSISPLTQLRIYFFNNRSVPGKVLYVDPWHDFAFIQFDPKHANITFELEEVVLGQHTSVKPGEKLMMIGHSSGSDYSIKYGNVNKPFVSFAVTNSSRYSHHLHLSLPRAGGASGSPLWNKNGEVVGLHSSGKNDESYELRIDYVQDALALLQQKKQPQRGDLLMHLETLRASTAIETWGLPEKYIQAGLKENKDLHYVLQISKLISNSETSKKLSVGDIIVGIKGHNQKQYLPIGYSLYEFDKLVNQNVGKKINLRVYRQNKKPSHFFEVSLNVEDAHKHLPKRFVKYAGAVFHQVTPSICFYYNCDLSGVFLNSADVGSTFDVLSGRLKEDGERTNERAIFISQINGIAVNNLNQLVKVLKTLRNGDLLSIVYSNSNYFYSGKNASSLELSTTTDPLRIFKWNQNSLTWEKE